MSIIKQISVYDGSSWGINDIGANAGNIDLIAPGSTVTTNLVGSTNLFTALNNILPTDRQLTASRALMTDPYKKLAASDTTATQLGYVHGVTSAIQTQINAINSKFIWQIVIKNTNITAIPANNVGDNEIIITKSGYTPIGIMGWNIGNGGPKLGCVYVRFFESGNDYVARIRLINVDSIAKTPSDLSVTILYVKN